MHLNLSTRVARWALVSRSSSTASFGYSAARWGCGTTGYHRRIETGPKRRRAKQVTRSRATRARPAPLEGRSGGGDFSREKLRTVKRDARATICIPTVRRLEFFREALESAVCQSFEDYEVLVSVNSPEPDYFHQISSAIERVKRTHPSRTIRLVCPPHFLQIADHMNFMVNEGGGGYWCCLGDDDRMEPHFLETLVPLLDSHADAGFAFSSYQVIDDQGTLRPELARKMFRSTHLDSLKTDFFPHVGLARLALWNALWLPCALFRRSILEAFPFEASNEAPDRDFWLRIADAQVDLGAVYAHVPLLNYRVHKEQYSQLTKKGQADWIRSLERCHSVARAEPKLHNRELACTYSMLAKALLVEGDRGGAWRALLVALRKNPFDRRLYRFVLQAALPTFLLGFLRAARDGRS